MPHPLAPLRLCRSRASARPALRLFLFQFLVSIFLYAFVKRTRSSQKTSRIKGSMVRIKYKVVGGRQGDQSYHHGSFPPITVLQDEMREHISPSRPARTAITATFAVDILTPIPPSHRDQQASRIERLPLPRTRLCGGGRRARYTHRAQRPSEGTRPATHTGETARLRVWRHVMSRHRMERATQQRSS